MPKSRKPRRKASRKTSRKGKKCPPGCVKKTLKRSRKSLKSSRRRVSRKASRKRRSVKRKASRKRRSVKRKASRKRRSVKRKASRKRRSVKRKASRKYKSVKRKVSRKRRSVKRKASRKRRSVKRKVSRKRRSVKRKASRKRRSVKRKASRKRRSVKRKASRKRKSVKKSHKFRLSNPFSAIREWNRTRRADAGFEKNLKAQRKEKGRRFREDLLTVIGRLHKGLPQKTYMEVAELFIEGAHGLSSSQRDTLLAKLKAGQKIPLSPDYARRYYGSRFTKEQYQKANNRRIAAVWKYYFKTKHKEHKAGGGTLSRDDFISSHKDELRDSQLAKVKPTISKIRSRLVQNLRESKRKANKAKYVEQQRIAQWNNTPLQEKYKKCKEYVEKFPNKDAMHHYKTHNCKSVMALRKQGKAVAAVAAAGAGSFLAAGGNKTAKKAECQKIKEKYMEIKNKQNKTEEERKLGLTFLQKFKQGNCKAILA